MGETITSEIHSEIYWPLDQTDENDRLMRLRKLCNKHITIFYRLNKKLAHNKRL